MNRRRETLTGSLYEFVCEYDAVQDANNARARQNKLDWTVIVIKHLWCAIITDYVAWPRNCYIRYEARN